MVVSVRLESLAGSSSTPYLVEKRLAQLLRVDLARVRRLTHDLPILLPVALSTIEAQSLVSELAEHGAHATIVERAIGESPSCEAHPQFLSLDSCKACHAPVCVFCKLEGAGVCPTCRERRARKRKRQKIRVAVLLVVLFVILLLAWKEMRRRSVDWSQPARVAVVLVKSGAGPLDSDLVQKFRDRKQEVEASLLREASRYYSPPLRPVHFSILGPVDENALPPAPPADELLSLLRFNLALNRYASKLDGLLGLEGGKFDVRIYVRAEGSEGQREAAEGLGQQRGKIGVVKAQFSEEGIDLVWFVVCHEFFHTRGATDKYDHLGHSMDPEGLYDPNQVPTYPQLGTEVMARGQPIARGKEEFPGAPATWGVGEWTAREIGWQGRRSD